MEPRKPIKTKPLHMYGESDYVEIKNKLPDIVDQAVKMASTRIEPTIDERNQVMDLIRDFLREKKRIVYGGTAIDEAVRAVNPNDRIYKDYNYGDVEFYSSTPVEDLYELSNEIYSKGFKFVIVYEAVHDESFTLSVNFHNYCDVTYMPRNIVANIQTLVIDGIYYVHPHFAFIDHLRIFTQPMTAADFRWEKTFPRMYKALKYYPLQQDNRPLQLEKPPKHAASILDKLRRDYICNMDKDICLISGYDAYNFYIRSSIRGTQDIKGRDADKKNNIVKKYLLEDLTFIELIAVNYVTTATSIGNYILSQVKNPDNITLVENAPLFQFTGRSVTIMLGDYPLVRVYDSEGMCVPNILTKSGCNYTSYQSTLMMLLINKFKSHVEGDKRAYRQYQIATSNLISARNNFLNQNKLGVINDTVFSEFQVGCIGHTDNYLRIAKIRTREKRAKKGHKQLRYEPAENQPNFDPTYRNGTFANASGNTLSPRKSIFTIIDRQMVLKDNSEDELSDVDESSEELTETDSE